MLLTSEWHSNGILFAPFFHTTKQRTNDQDHNANHVLPTTAIELVPAIPPRPRFDVGAYTLGEMPADDVNPNKLEDVVVAALLLAALNTKQPT